MMTTSDLRYPVLHLNKRGPVSVCADEATLNTLTNLALKDKMRIGSILLDSDGTAVEVKDVRFVSGLGSFWGYTIFGMRLIRVEHTLGEPFQMSLEDVKKRVLKSMRQGRASIVDSGFWTQLMRSVSEAKDAEELIALVLPVMEMSGGWQMIKKH